MLFIQLKHVHTSEQEIHASCKLTTVKSLMLTVIKKTVCNVYNHKLQI